MSRWVRLFCGCGVVVFLPFAVWGVAVRINNAGPVYTVIQNAVNNASDGDEIALSTGVFYQAVALTNRVLDFRGGYDETTTNWVGGDSVVDASGMDNAFVFLGSTCTVEGITMTHGDDMTVGGGGARLTSSDVVFDNCHVISNNGLNGGGLYVSAYSDAVLTNGTVVEYNTATWGGGAFVTESWLYVTDEDSDFLYNHGRSEAGGFYVVSGYVELNNGDLMYNYTTNLFQHGGGFCADASTVRIGPGVDIYLNRSFFGGGFYADDSTIYIDGTGGDGNNPAITHNEGTVGGGFCISNSQLHMASARFYNNQSIGHGGGGFAFSSRLTTGTNGISEEVLMDYNRSGFDGGALYLYQSTATLHDVVFGGDELLPNTCDSRGGALYLEQSVATIHGGKIEFNMATNEAFSFGGGLAANNSTLVLTNSVDYPQVLVKNNRVGSTNDCGGGVYLENMISTVRVYQALFQSNVAMRGGGFAASNSAVSFMSCDFNRNNALDQGGALYLVHGSVNLLDSELTGNLALTNGGALGLWDGDLVLVDSLVNSNDALFLGGAIYSEDSLDGTNNYCFLTNVQVVGNEAYSGGGLYLESINVVMEDVDIISNVATGHAGGGIFASAPTLGEFFVMRAVRRDCNVSYNSAERWGGGILSSARDPSRFLVQAAGTNMVRFESNQAKADGGALQAWGANVVVTGKVVFVANRAEGCGGAVNLTGTTKLRVRPSATDAPLFYANVSAGDGGAVNQDTYLDVVVDWHPPGTVDVAQADFLVNTAGSNGGAICTRAGRLIIDRGDFVQNVASNEGGAIWYQGTNITGYSSFARLTVSNAPFYSATNGWPLLFQGNRADNWGGAMHVRKCDDLHMDKVAVISNQAGNAGGMFSELGSFSLINALFAGNEDSVGTGVGGFYVSQGTGLVEQSTFVDNNRYGANFELGVYTLWNNIFWGHSYTQFTLSGTAYGGNNCVQNGTQYGSNNITNNPLLSATWHLLWGSPCIDAGTIILYADDIDGESRNMNNDIGVDEFVDWDGDHVPDVVESDSGVYVDETDTGGNPNSPYSDGDTFSDWQEWIADTDPNNSNDYLAVEAIAVSGTTVKISWRGGSAAALDFGSATCPTDTVWVAQTNMLPPTPRFGEVTLALTNQAVYRVKAYRP